MSRVAGVSSDFGHKSCNALASTPTLGLGCGPAGRVPSRRLPVPHTDAILTVAPCSRRWWLARLVAVRSTLSRLKLSPHTLFASAALVPKYPGLAASSARWREFLRGQGQRPAVDTRLLARAVDGEIADLAEAAFVALRGAVCRALHRGRERVRGNVVGQCDVGAGVERARELVGVLVGADQDHRHGPVSAVDSLPPEDRAAARAWSVRPRRTASTTACAVPEAERRRALPPAVCEGRTVCPSAESSRTRSSKTPRSLPISSTSSMRE